MSNMFFVESTVKIFALTKWQSQFLGSRQNWVHAALASVVAVGVSFTGIFQLLEWAFYDQVLRLRPLESVDPRIVVVTFDESDLEHIGSWPIADDVLAELLAKILGDEPRVVGLDLYRNLPVGNRGQERLAEIFRENDHLYGVAHYGKGGIGGSPILEALDRITLADLILDQDSKVRRSLLSTQGETGEIQLSLSTQLAVRFLEAEGIRPKRLADNAIQLGRATLKPLHGDEGGYVNVDTGGFQIFLNYRSLPSSFQTVSSVDILENRVSEEFFRDRLVLIGTTASTLNDFFYTPYNGELFFPPMSPVAGVMIHANAASQLISAALEGRSLLRTMPDYGEWLWVLGWSFLGTGLAGYGLGYQRELQAQKRHRLTIVVVFGLLEGFLLLTAAVAIALGLWIPIIPASFALGLSGLLTLLWTNRHLYNLATLDELTQVANRRSLDQHLEQIFADPRTAIALILCDVDFFKLYNDTYGHQAGDRCLQKVAKTMQETVRSQDLVARYGGEEFAVLLKGASPQLAEEIAQRICHRMQNLKIPHETSLASPYVSISCGVSTRTFDHHMTDEELIMMADQALYLSKKQGRNRVTLYKKPS